MTLNQIGGVLGAVALTAVLFLHGCDRAPPPSKPARVVEKVEAKPAPKKIEAKPAPKKVEPAPKVERRPKPAAPKEIPLPKQVPPRPRTVYKRVLPGGKLGDGITCAFVRDFVAGKTKEELEALQKQYQVSGDELAKYKACLN